MRKTAISRQWWVDRDIQQALSLVPTIHSQGCTFKLRVDQTAIHKVNQAGQWSPKNIVIDPSIVHPDNPHSCEIPSTNIAMGQSMDECALLGAIHSYAYALDNLDRDGMMAPFASDRPMTYNLSSFFGGEPQEWRPQDLYDAACSSLGGFTSTQHFLGAPVVTFHGENSSKATVKAQVCAYHWIQTETGVESAIAEGDWIVEAEKEGSRWLFPRFTFASAEAMPAQDVPTYGKAAERVKQGLGRAQVVT